MRLHQLWSARAPSAGKSVDHAADDLLILHVADCRRVLAQQRQPHRAPLHRNHKNFVAAVVLDLSRVLPEVIGYAGSVKVSYKNFREARLASRSLLRICRGKMNGDCGLL